MPDNLSSSARWRWAAVVLTALVTACGDNFTGGQGDPSCPDCEVDGGLIDAGIPGISCDDSNPCTADSVDGDDCRFDPVTDGALCEDGDLCTLGDQCQAGECTAGARAEGELAILGHLDNLTGRRIRLAPDRFLVVTIEDLFRGRVQVVSRSGDGLSTLASWAGDLTFVISGDDDILANAIEETDVVAVSAVGERDLHFFSASDDEVTRRSQLELSNQIISFTGRGDRLWLCSGNFVVGYQITLVDIADPDAPVEVGFMPLGPTQCGSTAINRNGSRVYFNTADGVRFIDATPLDTGGNPILSDIIAPPSGVSISGARLLLMAPTEVQILRESSLEELATVPVARARAATLFRDRLLVEGWRAVGGNTEVFVAWYDALGPGSPTLLDDTVLATFMGTGVGSTFRSATDGTTLLTRNRGYDLSEDRLDELRIPELLPLRTLARTAGGLRTYDSSGAAAIDVADPADPSFLAGGAFSEPRSILAFAVDEDALPSPTFASGLGRGFEDSTRVALDPSNPYYASPIRIDRWTLDAAADLQSEDWFSMSYEGTTQLATAGDFIYQFRRPDPSSGSSALRGYWLPALGGGEAAAPVFDLPLDGAATVNLVRRGFDVDPRARVAVVSTEAPADSGDLESVLRFYDLSTSPPTLVDQIATEVPFSQVRISGDRVVALAYDTIVFFERGQGEVARFSSESFERQLLAFDGNVAYVADLYIVPGTVTYELAAFTFGSPDPPFFVEVNSIARSLVPIDGGLAVGFDNQLLTVHPHCP